MENTTDNDPKPDAIPAGETVPGDPEEPSFADLFESHDRPRRDRRLQPGDPVQGRIVLITPEAVFIDYGAKAEGWAYPEEFLDAEGHPTVSTGDAVTLKFIEQTPSGVHLGTSLKKATGASGVGLARSAYEAQVPIEGTVTKVNRGGLEVTISGASAFCPLSQIELFYCEKPEAYVGTTQSFMITEMEEEGRRIILSRKAVIQLEREAQAVQTRERLAEGALFEGTVTRLTPFGAFVDLGGIEGLLHVSEISREQVPDPADRLHVGQSVQVMVLRLDRGDKGEERISLSMKALEPDPWEIGLGFGEGETIAGTVKNLTQYGAFVEVAPGVEGLVHISEISPKRITHPQQVLSPGQQVAVKVLSIDRERKRVSLSIREAAEAQEEETADFFQSRSGDIIRRGRTRERIADQQGEGADPDEKGPSPDPGADQPASPTPPRTPRVGLITRGIVSGIKPYGLFMDLPELGSRTRGLLHQSEFQPASGSSSLKGVKEGDEIEVQIIRVDDQGKISLSQKSIHLQREASDLKEYLGQSRGSGGLGTLADLLKPKKPRP